MWQWIAMITMAIDHIGTIFFPDQPLWRVIGRIAFPVYAWLLVKGYVHTRSVPAYMLRLLILFAAAQLPYMAAFQTMKINVIGTLFLSLTVLWAMDLPSTRTKWLVIPTAFVLLAFFPFDYGLYGLILVLIYRYVTSYWAVAAHAAATWMFFLAAPVQFFSVFATAMLYSDVIANRRSVPAWLWRSFYPLHLALFFLLTWWI